MKTNLTVRGTASPGRGDVALLLLTVLFLCAVSQAAFAGGNSSRNEQRLATPETRILIQSDPAVKPEWVDIVPQSTSDIFFVGSSQPFDTVANARDSARESARTQVLEYYGQVIERQAVALSAVSGSTRDTLASYISREDEIRSFAQNVVSEVATISYYTETYLTRSNKEEYIVYTLHSISRQKAEDEISNFAHNISERYTAAIPQWNTLRTALVGYTFIVRTLEQNPLHRIMAYYSVLGGRAGLYEYARFQISELANSISIEPLPSRSIQETESLSTQVRLRSSILPATGLLDCQASIFGMVSEDISYPFRVANDDPYNLQIRNVRPGSYNVSIEILLSNMTGGIARNISSGFSFEVTPLSIVLNTQDALEAGIKRAVDTLAARLQAPTETIIGVFSMTGTDIPSELSIFLSEKVTHYAKNNPERKYRIVDSEAGNRAVLAGFFTRRNDRVDVTLELSTPGSNADSRADGSQIFSISTALLEIIGIAIEPENMHRMINLDEMVPAPAETIHIAASFNSSTRTFMHGDGLILTISADRDCYFKVIHIDVDNQIKTIYPAANDNNFLRANASRTIFNSPNRYVLCGPYGAETLVIVASPVQFPNIAQEYREPWKAATEEAIRAAIAGAGQARYPITILRPHEEYEFTRPENMTATYQAIRDDAIRQGGYFEGNAVTGFYIINNIRGSYLAPDDKPDTIQFATYFLDTYSGNTTTATRTRGSAFNFSFERPQNINQALQTVQSSVQSKGGTCTGNEQQGSFRASGIVGQYRVSNMVNVTITEKPFIVPNSLIESEVKKFFGVR
jgi:hypothetical protein